MVVYNEFEPYAAAWLRNLCERNLIAPGAVDERSIRDLSPDDVAGPGQRHFFAGIGGWSLALRLAGWPDDLDVWTGSCPCQPFSAAGQRKGTADDRHLWPDWFRLIDACRPAVVFGEQVASKDALDWLDTVSTDLEGAGYTCAALDICAAGVGAPHIRQRLWWVAIRVADSTVERLEGYGQRGHSRQGRQGAAAERGCGDGRLANPYGGNTGAEREQRGGEQRQQPQDCSAGRLADDDKGRRAIVSAPRVHADGQPRHDAAGCGEAFGVGDAECWSAERQRFHMGAAPRAAEGDARQRQRFRTDAGPAEFVSVLARYEPAARNDWSSPTHGFWGSTDWLYCRDGKWRPVEPGLEPLVNGVSNRVGRLRAYGNAIVPQVAAEFIGAVMEWLEL